MPVQPVEVPTRLRPGDLLQRYVILGELGAGGMAVVYKAYDSGLDRAVALKVLQVGGVVGSGDEARRMRLLREAQALARLSHPNVTSIYDVGAHEGILFIAMEYVEGRTLGYWLAEKPRSLDEILEAFTAAGRGLAAAHAVELVHRDFKASNVLVGNDGRVRVVDFGLARLFESEENRAPSEPVQEPAAEMKQLLESPLTRMGTVLGTPAYMAPEQHLGLLVDHRSDQYSFCVALFDAVYGAKPFSVDQIIALKERKTSRWIPDIPPGKEVPAWLRHVLERGLREGAAERYPSMKALLADLSRDARARRRRWAWMAGLAPAVVVAGFLLVRSTSARSDLCHDAGKHLAAAWDGTARAKLESAFLATGREDAAARARRTAQALDDYASRWSAMYTDACEATHVRGEQSAGMLDAKMRCLDHYQNRLGAVVATLADHPDGPVVDRAVEAAMALPPPSPCADEDTLRARYGSPRSAPALEIETQLDQARALRSLGKATAAVENMRSAATRAASLGDPALEAEASLVLGMLLQDAGETKQAEPALRRAVEAAALAKDDAAIARAWLELVSLLVQSGRRPEATHLLRAADVSIRRANGSVELDARLRASRGAIEQAAGELDAARDDLERALAERKSVLGEHHPDVAAALAALAAVERQRGDRGRAQAHYEQALVIDDNAFADPLLIEGVLTPLGQCLIEQGRPRDAVPILERSLGILTSHQASPAGLAGARFALARALWAQGVDQQRALALARLASAAYLDGGERFASKQAAVAEWLAARPTRGGTR